MNYPVDELTELGLNFLSLDAFHFLKAKMGIWEINYLSCAEISTIFDFEELRGVLLVSENLKILALEVLCLAVSGTCF